MSASEPTRRCPTCKRRAIKDGNKLFPFCSERCHLIDLGKWLGEEYRVPDEGAPPPKPDDDER